MGDRNLIQLKRGQAWHYWNFGNMMPICGAGEASLSNPLHPNEFTRSMHCGFKKVKKVCERCKTLEHEQSSKTLDAELEERAVTIVTELNESCHLPNAVNILRALYNKGIVEGRKQAKEEQ